MVNIDVRKILPFLVSVLVFAAMVVVLACLHQTIKLFHHVSTAVVRKLSDNNHPIIEEFDLQS